MFENVETRSEKFSRNRGNPFSDTETRSGKSRFESSAWADQLALIFDELSMNFFFTQMVICFRLETIDIVFYVQIRIFRYINVTLSKGEQPLGIGHGKLSFLDMP